MTPTLRIQLFGKATILNGSQTEVVLPAKAQELFFYLLLYNSRPHEREGLCTLLWPDQSSERAKKYLRQSIWHLQTALSDLIQTENSVLSLDGNWVHLNSTAAISLDAERLAQIFAQVRHTPAQEVTPQQSAQMHDIVNLYHGALLTGWYQDWCILERERFQSMVLALLDKLIDYALHNHLYTDGIDYARQILHVDCARERTHRALMRLHYLNNDRSAALRQYEHCTNALTRELNVKPAKRTIALYQQLQADQLDEQWLKATERCAATLSPNQETQAVSEQEPSFIQTLGTIRQMVSTIHKDISTIKRALEL